MPFATWTVGITLIATSNIGRVMAQGALQTRAMNKDIVTAEGSLARISQSATKLGTVWSGIGAAAGASFMAYGVTQAALLERAMTGVQIATAATADQYARLKAMAIDVSGVTAQSAVTIANEMAAASKVAFHDPKQLEAVFPMMAKYADVRYMATQGKEDPVNSIDQMSQVAHLFAAYTPETMKPLLDNVARLQMTTEASLQQLRTQGKYFIPAAKEQGVPEDTLFQYLGIMGQLGMLSGRGGTSMKNLVLGAMQVTPTAFLSQAKSNALDDLNLRDKSGTFRFIQPDTPANRKAGSVGNLDLVGLISYLREQQARMKITDPRHANSRMITDIGAIWTQAAVPLITALLAKTTEQQMTRNVTASKKIPGVDGQWEMYRHDLFYQFKAFKINLQNLAMSLGGPFVKDLTKMFGDMATGIGSFVSFLNKNPGVAKSIGTYIAALTGVMSIRFGVGSFVLITGALKGLAGVGDLGEAATGVTALSRALTLFDGLFLAGMGGRLAGTLLLLRSALIAVTTANSWAVLVTYLGGVGIAIGACAGLVLAALGSLAAMIVGFPALNKALGLHKTPTTPAEHAAGKKAFQPRTPVGGTGRLGAQHYSHPYSAPVPSVKAGTQARGFRATTAAADHRQKTRDDAGPSHTTNHNYSVTVNVQGGSDPQKHGETAGSAFVSILRQQGLLRNAPLGAGFGNAVPAAH